jgi:hypothetical protein
MGLKAINSVKWSVLRLINFVRNEKVTKFD